MTENETFHKVMADTMVERSEKWVLQLYLHKYIIEIRLPHAHLEINVLGGNNATTNRMIIEAIKSP